MIWMRCEWMRSREWRSTRIFWRCREHARGGSIFRRALSCIRYAGGESLRMRTKGNPWTMPKQSGIRLARRLDEVGFSDIVQIRNKVMEMRAAGLQVHSLHGGEPYFETPEPIKYAAMRALVENYTHYAPSSGVLPLRKALVEKLGAKNKIPATVDEVIATVGGSQGLYAAFQSVLDPGDDALVFSPYWTPIGDLVT